MGFDPDIYMWNNNSYITSGTYNSLFTNEFGCDSVANLVLSFVPRPTPDFTHEQLNICDPTINFNNTSNNFTISFWDFGDDNYSHDMNPSHRYNYPGEYVVTLLVTDNGSGCLDSISYIVNSVDEDINVFFPNSFTPNNDDLNEEFQVYADIIQDYEMSIYNRWN